MFDTFVFLWYYNCLKEGFTMSDIKIWCEKADNKGIREYMWFKNHLKFELFRLGRLQFQIYPCKNKTLLYNKYIIQDYQLIFS